MFPLFLAFTGLATAMPATDQPWIPRDPVLYPDEVFESDEVGAGEIRVVTDDAHGAFGALVLEHTSVLAEVHAGLARVTLSQWFYNPYEAPIAATYLLPLPPGAAVDRMDLVCGERRIEGVVMERGAARAEYDLALQDGRKAALLEQVRDDLFRQSISNLCPGEEVEVMLQWVQQVEYDDGEYSWDLPLTVGPRFSPPWVEDAALLDTPYARDAQKVDVTVVLEEGMPVDGLKSDTHDIAVEDEGEWGVEVVLAEGETLPNADFHLAWTLNGLEPRAAALVTEPDVAGGGYIALTVEPPELGPAFRARPRELIFIVDQSCSMQGEPYEVASAAIRRALRGMRADDTFNLVRFSDDAGVLFPSSQASTADTRAQADAWLGDFSGGSTWMEKGLVTALDLPARPEALRILVMLTDGYVGNDAQLFQLTRQHMGRTRLFSLGVGSAPNRHLLEGLAELGRGDAIYHRPGTSVTRAVNTFYARIAHPSLTDLRIDWGGLKVTDQYPSRLPDVWAGQPVRVVARYQVPAVPEDLSVTLHGIVGTQAFVAEMPVDVSPGDSRNEAVATLWARRKIHDLERHPRISAVETRHAVTEVALEHGIVSRYTSLLAMDEDPAGCGGAVVDVAVPHLPPVGMATKKADRADVDLLAPFIGPTTRQIGAGGLASSGRGLGGGGYAESLGGFGVRGRGSSGHGSGGGNFGSKIESYIVSVPSDPIVLGSTDHSLVDAVIKRGISQIRYCYQRRLQVVPTLAGRVDVKFVIGADGAVASAEIKSSTLGDIQVEECIRGRFLRWTFPEPKGGGVVIVNYPFVFMPG